MTYNIRFRRLAARDIDNAVTYLLEKLSAPRAAADLLDALDEIFDQIREYPYGCPLWRTELPLAEEIRYITVKNYVLYYVVTGDTVEICRFLHGRKNRQASDMIQ